MMEAGEIEKQAVALRAESGALVVDSPERYAAAGEFLKGVKRYAAAVEEAFGPVVKSAHTAWKSAVAQRDKFLEPAADAERTVKGRMSTWFQEQERIRRAEEARLQAEAQRAAEEDRLAQAVAAEEAGEQEVADALADAPVVAPPVVVPRSAPDVKGVSVRSVWRWRVADERLVPREYLTIDEQKIGGVVRALKGQARIPGVEVFEEKSVVAGRL
jgi:hypothetical protein